jgi:hypothetical protein
MTKAERIAAGLENIEPVRVVQLALLIGAGLFLWSHRYRIQAAMPDARWSPM